MRYDGFLHIFKQNGIGIGHKLGLCDRPPVGMAILGESRDPIGQGVVLHKPVLVEDERQPPLHHISGGHHCKDVEEGARQVGWLRVLGSDCDYEHEIRHPVDGGEEKHGEDRRGQAGHDGGADTLRNGDGGRVEIRILWRGVLGLDWVADAFGDDAWHCWVGFGLVWVGLFWFALFWICLGLLFWNVYSEL